MRAKLMLSVPISLFLSTPSPVYAQQPLPVRYDSEVVVEADAQELINRARPLLAAQKMSATPTTRNIAESSVAKANPTNIVTKAYSIETVCNGDYCAESLRIGGKVVSSGRHRIAQLKIEANCDTTEVILPQPSTDGFVSLYRMNSSYANGAAHAVNILRCESWLTSGRRATVSDVVGKANAAQVQLAAATTYADFEGNIDPMSFLVSQEGSIIFCVPDQTQTVIHSITIKSK
jgi:hypothetical protein